MDNSRLIAQKTCISTLLKGNFIKENNQVYLNFKNQKISKVNLMGIVINKSAEGLNSLLIEDGTGKIMLRFFEEKNNYQNIKTGDLVLVIGFIREFNDERYISPQIIKKLNNKKWLQLRKTELKKITASKKDNKQTNNKLKKEKNKQEEQEEKNKDEEKESFHKKIIQTIKDLDSGKGVTIQKINQKFKTKDIEKIIDQLLERGEIFEIEPGQVKVLE